MFFERLLLLCGKNKTDVSNVLRALGLSTSKGTAWRNGSVPNGEILLMLANYFHVSTDYLLGSTDDPRPPTELTREQKETAPERGGRVAEFMDLFNRLSPEDQEREIAYLRSRVDE